MKIEIKDKEYELKWDLQAIDYLDKVYTLDFNMAGQTMSFGAGLQSGVAQLNMGNPLVLFHFLKAGLKHYKGINFKDETIEKALYERAEKDDGLDKLTKDIRKSLKDNPLTRQSVSSLDEEVEEVKEKAHKKKKEDK